MELGLINWLVLKSTTESAKSALWSVQMNAPWGHVLKKHSSVGLPIFCCFDELIKNKKGFPLIYRDG